MSDLKHKISETAENVKNSAKEMADKVGHAVAEGVHKGEHALSDAASKAKNAVKSASEKVPGKDNPRDGAILHASPPSAGDKFKQAGDKAKKVAH